MRRLQRGAALLVLLAVLVLGASWFLVSRLDALSAGIFTASNRNHNALVLSQAKQALIGYVAMNAAQSGENNPGRFPCPEGAALVGTSAEGISAPYVGPPNAPTCATVGRLPWRTLGLDKLVDSSAEPLWYVVSPGWQLVTSTTTLTINSNTIGQLNVDGQANAAVALIIAPGAAMNVAASAGCTARNQARSAPAPTMDARDYIECFNTGTSTFATTGATTSFNDQVVRITVADVMPGIEAAIASRVEREIAPLLRGVYATNSWGANVSAGNPVYAFAAPFADPSLTASYQGGSASCAGGVCKGLLPVTFSNAPGTSTPCTPSAGSPCDPTFVRWVSPPAPVFTRTGGATLRSANCSVLAASVDCSVMASVPVLGAGTSMNFTLAATADKVGMALRKFDTTVAMTGIDPAGRSIVVPPTVPSTAMALDGSVRVILSGSIPISGGNLISDALCTLLGLTCYQMNISMPITLLADHPVLNSTDPVTGWFMRNEWYRVLYYAAAQTTTPAALPTAPACTPGTNCVTVSNLTPANNKRAILILTGRSINASARPSGTLADYLEFGNATGSFERQPVSTAVDAALKKPFNDRVVVVDVN